MSDRRRDSVGPTSPVQIERKASLDSSQRIEIGGVKHQGANRIVVECFELVGTGTAITIAPMLDSASPDYFNCRGQIVRVQRVQEEDGVRWLAEVVLDPFPVRFINNLERFFETFGDESKLASPGSIQAELILDSAGPSQTLRPSKAPVIASAPSRYGFVDKTYQTKRKSKPPEG